MVVKLMILLFVVNPQFEYGVILNGSQTMILLFVVKTQFEYGVILMVVKLPL